MVSGPDAALALMHHLVHTFLRNSGATTIKVPRGGAIRNFEVDSPSVDIASRRTSNNDVPSGDELCTATLLWFQENKPEMVRAKLVVTFEERGWVVLFTPPYCPDLQGNVRTHAPKCSLH